MAPLYPIPLAQSAPYANHSDQSSPPPPPPPPQPSQPSDEPGAEAETKVAIHATKKPRPKSGLMSRYLAPPSFARRGVQMQKADKRKGALFPTGIITRTDEFEVEISKPRELTQSTLSSPYHIVAPGPTEAKEDRSGDSSSSAQGAAAAAKVSGDGGIALPGKPRARMSPATSPTSPCVFPSRKMRGEVKEQSPDHTFNLRSPTLASLSAAGLSPSTSAFHSMSRKTPGPTRASKPHALRWRGGTKHDSGTQDAPEWYRAYQDLKREEEKEVQKEDKRERERRKKEEKEAEKAARRDKEKKAREQLGREGMFVDAFLLG